MTTEEEQRRENAERIVDGIFSLLSKLRPADPDEGKWMPVMGQWGTWSRMFPWRDFSEIRSELVPAYVAFQLNRDRCYQRGYPRYWLAWVERLYVKDCPDDAKFVFENTPVLVCDIDRYGVYSLESSSFDIQLGDLDDTAVKLGKYRERVEAKLGKHDTLIEHLKEMLADVEQKDLAKLLEDAEEEARRAREQAPEQSKSEGDDATV